MTLLEKYAARERLLIALNDALNAATSLADEAHQSYDSQPTATDSNGELWFLAPHKAEHDELFAVRAELIEKQLQTIINDLHDDLPDAHWAPRISYREIYAQMERDTPHEHHHP